MSAVRILGIASTVFLVGAVALIVHGRSAWAQPEVTMTNVESGDVLESAPEVFHLCFSEPVNNQDQADYEPEEEGEVPWEFGVALPDGQQLGLRIVFEADGDCVDVFPGLPEEPVEGIWQFDWMVRSQETNEEASDVVLFRVGPGDPPIVEEESDEGDDTALIAIIAVGVAAVAAAGIGSAVIVAGRRRNKGSGG